MAKYESGDIVTYYFIIKENKNDKMIQGWTDNKSIANFYMEFHKAKGFRIKSITNTIDEINKILDDNWNDEIKMCNIITRNRGKHRKGEEIASIVIPATSTELAFIREEANTFMTSRINYSFINDAIPYLKNRYQDALKSIFLSDVVLKVIYNKNSKFTQLIEFDQLMILFRSFPENFGE